MKTKKHYTILLTMVLGVMVAGYDASAQESKVEAGKVAAEATKPGVPSEATPSGKSDVASTRPKGPIEGIKVHGHWVIEVRNPDGMLVRRREFDNALASGAGDFLQGFLSRDRTVGGWRIQLSDSTTGFRPCVGNAAGFRGPCIIAESTDPSTDGNVFKNLTVSNGPTGLVLAGTATAAKTNDIDRVETFLEDCPNSVAPSACPGGGSGLTHASITSAALSPSVSVQPNQSVQATVTIKLQ